MRSLASSGKCIGWHGLSDYKKRLAAYQARKAEKADKAA